MQTHDIHAGTWKEKKRIGRGGKRGTYSGRGNKGQKARSGAHVNPLFEGGRSSLVERLKKVRGFKSPHAKKLYVKFSDIVRVFIFGETVSLSTLVEKKLLPSDALKSGAKVIGTGSIPKGVLFDSALLLSEGVRALIEKSDAFVQRKKEEK